MIEYILIIMAFNSLTTYAALPVVMQEFGSKAACENAVQEMKFTREHVIPLQKSTLVFNCVPKTL